MLKVMSVFGTRPEAVKMCPLVKALEQNDAIESIVCVTGQHKEMLQQVLDIFKTDVKYNLDIMRSGQTLTTITTAILEKIEPVLQKEKPDLILVHGDTTTSFAAALAAFYQKIPVGHVEAGLRTNNRYSPYPEEMNRNLTGRIAELHFSPTEYNRENLKREHITEHVYVTGNTVIDAFQTTVKRDYIFDNEQLQNMMHSPRKKVLITAHRRENLGEPLQHICEAVKYLAEKYPEMDFIYPMHLNPLVQNTAKQVLEHLENVYLLDPLHVQDMHNVISRCFLILTDSGGLQEEAPYFGVPVLVMRSETERPEAVTAGTVRIVGTAMADISAEAERLIRDPKEYNLMAQAVSPYGDGHASEKIVRHILEWKKNEYDKGII